MEIIFTLIRLLFIVLYDNYDKISLKLFGKKSNICRY